MDPATPSKTRETRERSRHRIRHCLRSSGGEAFTLLYNTEQGGSVRSALEKCYMMTLRSIHTAIQLRTRNPGTPMRVDQNEKLRNQALGSPTQSTDPSTLMLTLRQGLVVERCDCRHMDFLLTVLARSSAPRLSGASLKRPQPELLFGGASYAFSWPPAPPG